MARNPFSFIELPSILGQCSRKMFDKILRNEKNSRPQPQVYIITRFEA